MYFLSEKHVCSFLKNHSAVTKWQNNAESFFIRNNSVHDHIKIFRYLYWIFAGNMQCFIFRIFPSEIIDQKDLLLHNISHYAVEHCTVFWQILWGVGFISGSWGSIWKSIPAGFFALLFFCTPDYCRVQFFTLVSWMWIN